MSAFTHRASGSMDFRELQFGYAEAEVESAENPALLVEGYLDNGKVIQKLVSGHEFLVLGYKGSGKSAIAEHIRLLADTDPQLFVSVTSVADFPFAEFADIIRGNAEPEAKLPTAWSWLILVRLFALLAEDEGAESAIAGEFPAARRVMKGLGLLPAPELKRIASISSSAASSYRYQWFLKALLSVIDEMRRCEFQCLPSGCFK